MAKFYPDRPGPDTPRSELDVWEALEQLPNSWRVFHSVAWQVPNERRVFDGEADFVLLHKRYGFIVLEVKGGRVWVEDGTWFQGSRDGSVHQLPRSPFEQARRAMYDLGSYFERTTPETAGLAATRAVVLPAASHPGSMGPDAPVEQIISRDELPDMATAIERLTNYAKLGADIPALTIDRITQLLAPTLRLSVLLSTRIGEANRAIVDLTDRQIRLLDFLRRQDRALITGGAGTGKTILAMERARRLADEGLRTLLVCFNRPLADHIVSTLQNDTITVGSFHQFALDRVKRAGFVVGNEPGSDWWAKELPDLLPQAAERLGETFDALVVDEGQDFRSEWFTALQLLLVEPDSAPMYVFYDEKQTIYLDGWEPPFDAEPFPLTTNCRNTSPIAEKVARVIGIDPSSLGATGVPPVWIPAEDSDEVCAQLEQVLDGLISKEGVDPDQIVVLADRRPVVDALRGQTVGGTKLHDLGGPGTVVETVHRFKGLEADVVVLILSEINSDRDRAVAYIGMSRARALLIVIGPKHLKGEVGW